MFKCIVAAIAVLWGSVAIAADQPRYAPPAAWVKPAPIPEALPSQDGSALQILLLDGQSRLGTESDEFYTESVGRILTPQGLASAATISISWSPDTETLTIHRVAILRDGKAIDLLAGGKAVTVLRRENNLELAMLDGRLTATVQPEGLRVGDVLDIAMTLERRDPVLQGRSEAFGALRYAGPAGRVRLRDIWQDGKAIAWRTTAGMPQPTISHANGVTELLIDQLNALAPKPPALAPQRFNDVGVLEVSQFKSWAEVSTLMAPLYAKASTLAADSVLKAEAARIRAASDDPKVRTEAALRLVQDQVHYVFLGMNSGGYVPANADITWSRRFGDCKGKTALLLALLRELDVAAQPALVNTRDGDALDQRLPMLTFDHVFVRAVIKGKVYWLDGTRSDDRDLDEIPVPDFRWVLPVQAAGARLEKVQPKPYAAPAFESLKQIDASAGYEAPAKADLQQIFRGDTAVAWRHALSALGHDDAERRLKEYWRGQAAWVEPKSVAFAYDDQHHVMRLTADGSGKMDWNQIGDVRDFDIGDSNLGFNTSFKREPGPNADAPISVPYPVFNRWTVTIVLPAKGAAFHLLGASDVDTTVAGRHFARRSRLEGGVVTMTAQEQSLASEFPHAEADAASVELRKLASRDVVVRGAGTPTMDPLPAVEDELATPPADAPAFSQRGLAFLARHDYDRAIADFSAAARLQPAEGKYVYNRGAARYEKRDDAGALADFNQALRLNPKDGLAYAARADLLLAKGDSRHGWSDYDQAVKQAPNDLQIRERRAHAYERAGRYSDGLRDLDAALERTPSAHRLALLNERCWIRAEWGRELSTALADCDAALALAPNLAAVLDSRGLVNLRMGQYDQAIADYDGALRQSPKEASSLFGRGMAKIGKGRVEEGRSDIAAARVAAPEVDAQFARYGLKAPT